jgi:hypothetical protein
MTNIIQQQDNFLRSTKQRIVQNLNDIDCPIDIVAGSAEDMYAATRPYGDMSALITVAEILRSLQAETIAFSETNVEWNKYQMRDNNMQKLFIKAFGAARMEYSTTSDKFEMTYHKPGGTISGALGQMVHSVVDSGRDNTGCGRWSYITYAEKEGKKIAIV